MKIGFIGLGLMGNPMAKNIKKAGFDLMVYNRNQNRLKEFEDIGVPIAPSPKDLASQANIIITMVTGPEDVKEVLLGPLGVASSENTGLIVIDMSTIGPTVAQEISQELEKKGIEFLDAPVTGSVEKATSGELTIFIGGKEEIFQKVKPVFEAMGTNLQYMGLAGSGQAIKLVNNLMVAANIESLAEGLILGEKMGLSKEKLGKALENVPVVSPMLQMKLPKMVSGNFQAAFSLTNQTKDLKLAKIEAQKAELNLPSLEKMTELYQKGMEEGLKDEDNSAIIKVLQEKN